MKINYQKKLNDILANLKTKPQLLLHSCCAPCSSYVLEYLSQYFFITVLYYNPNIAPDAEYKRRKNEQIHLISTMPLQTPVEFLDAPFDSNAFYGAVKGLETEPEGGKRCEVCFKLRLEYTAKIASENNFDYFCTTLTISPHKNAQCINEIGERLAKQYSMPFLPSDFKKNEGFKRSLTLSDQYGLYRQDYCGCAFSMRDI